MTSATATVSVIIPTHKRPELLARAIQSVLAQTFSDYEVLVVENGDSHGGRAVAEAFAAAGAPIHYLYDPLASLPNARNVGIEASRGAYIAFLDDDDEWLPTKLERQVAILQASASVGLVSCRAWRVDLAGNILDEANDYRGEPTFQAFVREWGLIHSPSAIVFRRACVERIGLFEMKYVSTNDYEFYLRFSREFGCVTIQEPLFRYRLHRGAANGNMSANLGRQMREIIEILRALRPAKHLGVTRRTIHERIAKFYYVLAVEALDLSAYGTALQQFLLAAFYDPSVGRKILWRRTTNPFYCLCRPYLAAGYCLWRWIGSCGRPAQPVGQGASSP